MTRAQVVGLVLVVALLALLGALAERPEAGPTTYGAQADGLLTAHAWLEAQGVQVQRWERNLDELPQARGTLLVAAPLQVGWTDADARAVRTWASQGGRVVLVASGTAPRASEQAMLDTFGITVGPRREDAPTGWRAWSDWRSREHTAAGLQPGWPAQVRMRLETHGPRAPEGASVLYADDEGHALAWTLRWPPGEVVVLANSSALDNAGLAQADNLELLQALLAAEPPLWVDERHHGHLAADARGLSGVLGPFELMMAHLALVYAVAAWTVSRRMGPPLAAEEDRRGSVARDLRRLARLHRKSGHAPQAGARLLALAWDLARRRGSHPAELPPHFEGDEAELQALARTVGRLQAEGRL